MVRWDSLPHDIRLLLLRTFCGEIINDFESLSTSIWDIADDSYFDNEPDFENPPPREWPPTPAPLKSFMSAITTCREFNHIILQQVKFDGRSPLDVLKGQQLHSVDQLIRTYYDEVSSSVVNVALYCQATGCFWKNPLIMESNAIIPSVLRCTTTHSSQILLPHIEPWLNHLFRVPEDSDGPPPDVRLSDFADSRGETRISSHFQIKWGSKHFNQEIGTVDSVSRDLGDGPSLVEEDISQSPAEQWWLFLPLSLEAQYHELEWMLVNYREQRMYVGPNASEALAWRGRDVYDMSTWARLTSIEEIRDYGRN
jgi:hypothetical protein